MAFCLHSYASFLSRDLVFVPFLMNNKYLAESDMGLLPSRKMCPALPVHWIGIIISGIACIELTHGSYLIDCVIFLEQWHCF